MLKLWKWYQQCLSAHPVKTQMVSSWVLWSTGDISAQYITHATAVSRHKKSDEEAEFKVNWKRVGITGLFGFAFVGPVGHYWYEGLDKITRSRFRLPPNSLRFITAKVAADTLIFAPVNLLVFFAYMGLSAGKTVAQVQEDVRRDFIPAMLMEASVWPTVQVVNFRYVPVQHQLLYVNTFCLLDSAFLSWFEQQNDAPWKKWFTSVKPLKEKDRLGTDSETVSG